LKKTLKLVAVFAASALAFGVAAPAAHAATATKACLALDTGGVDDKSFNALAWKGANVDAKKKNPSVTAKYLAATSDADYAPNIKKLVDEKCDIIIGVGFAINEAIVAAAKANPTVHFAIVDQDGLSDGKPVANLKSIQYVTDAPSFQAGYLAAGVSKTGKVATYGGMPFPTVTTFMDGFAKGVAHYNKVKGKKVAVLGWDTAKKDGTFVGNFSDSAKALQISKNFEQQGADVIFPVAGGLGGATAGNSVTSKKSVVIWVDSDGYIAAPKYKKVILTSVLKGVDLGVSNTIAEQAAGKFTNAAYVGTMKNGGAFLAPYHDLIRMVPSALRKEVSTLGTDLRNGKVTVK
jgi:basic membrane protein A